MTSERDETIKKFEENEEIWNKRTDKLNADQKSLFEMNQGMKDDNRDLMI
jgi:hypothetical protein